MSGRLATAFGREVVGTEVTGTEVEVGEIEGGGLGGVKSLYSLGGDAGSGALVCGTSGIAAFVPSLQRPGVTEQGVRSYGPSSPSSPELISIKRHGSPSPKTRPSSPGLISIKRHGSS